MRWCLPWQDKVAVLQILKTVLRGIWRPSYILITQFSQPEESAGGKMCGRACFGLFGFVCYLFLVLFLRGFNRK